MNCGQALQDVYSFLDGELTSIRRSQIEWHLRKCGECWGEFNFEERLLLLVQTSCRSESIDIPSELLTRLRALIHKEATGGLGK
jgi:mycothiol system anti-sigma-R factor